jgi:hypothetical protein
MIETKEGICRVCNKKRLLNLSDVCIFCERNPQPNGVEIKSKSKDDNLWMTKF